ncbi:MAG: F0F1 ATP synthase subunit epsilon [Proteobacteria bacterium]|nr:MAG: F0F1 ATP synthase subunit epsilon [Pseudomonadota bacterium]
MGDQVQFELVTPERLVVSEPVDMVVVPGSEGDFGVLPGHAPLISTVRPGVIETYAGKAVKDRIFVAGGFAEVTRERCTVLAEEAVPVAELDRSQIESEAAAAREDIGLARDAGERAAAERALAVAEAKLQLIQRTAQ